MKKYFLNNKSVLKLIAGNTIAQAIPLLVSPLLSRLYAPSEYALLGLLLAGSNVLFEIYCLKYDRPVVVESNKSYSLNILFLCFIISLSFTVLLLLFFSSTDIFSRFDKIDNVQIFSYVLPLITFFMSTVTAVYYWFQREQNFRMIVISKIIQMGSISGFSILFGYLYLKNGMVYGYLMGWFIVFLLVMLYGFKYDFELKELSAKRMREMFKKYIVYPKYNIATSVLYVAGLSFPYYYVPYLFGEEPAGYFNLCKQMLLVPLSFIGASFAQVYFKKISNNFNNNTPVFPVVREMLVPLLLVFVISNVVISTVGHNIFGIVFGSRWENSGEMARIYIISATTQMISMAMSVVFPSMKLIKLESILKLIYFVSIMAVCVLISYNNINTFLIYYTVLEFIYFLICITLCIIIIKKFDKNLEKNAVN